LCGLRNTVPRARTVQYSTVYHSNTVPRSTSSIDESVIATVLKVAIYPPQNQHLLFYIHAVMLIVGCTSQDGRPAKSAR
jgi:hypothetical protein